MILPLIADTMNQFKNTPNKNTNPLPIRIPSFKIRTNPIAPGRIKISNVIATNKLNTFANTLIILDSKMCYSYFIWCDH